MLTRLQVHGFKNLLDVDVEFGPFTCIAGRNGIGKSNLFDAIEFLSRLADGTFVDAVRGVRVSHGSGGTDPRDLFRDGYGADEHEMRFAVEMVVPEHVVDELGVTDKATTTFLRYEIALGYEPAERGVGGGRMVLLHEELTHIKKSEAPRRLRFPHSAGKFRAEVLKGHRSGGEFISTAEHSGGTVVNLHGDGGSRGRPQPRAAARAGRTFLSSITTTEYPTILAAQQEMKRWRRLALEPSALRAPDSLDSPTSLGGDGSHLASTLYRIAHTDTDGTGPDPRMVLTRVANRLSDLIGTGVREIEVELDPVREAFTVFLLNGDGVKLPARALSEGTLRFLALCVLKEDTNASGVLCMEEPENGIHPAQLPAILDLLRDLAMDTTLAPDQDNPFRQVIINTHSPGLVMLSHEDDLLLAEERQLGKEKPTRHGLVLRPFQGSWRTKDSPGKPSLPGGTFTRADLLEYLAGPEGAIHSLPEEKRS